MKAKALITGSKRIITILITGGMAISLCGCSVTVNPQSVGSQAASAVISPESDEDYDEVLDVKSGEVDPEDYTETKEDILEIQEQIALDELNPREDELEARLEKYKEAADSLYTPDMIYGIVDGDDKAAKDTDLYRFCLDLPKGADLHVHNYYGIPKDRLLSVIENYPGIRIVLDQKAEDYGCLYGPKDDTTPDYAILLSKALSDGTVRMSDLRHMLSLKGVGDSREEWEDMNLMLARLRHLMYDYDLAVKLYEESLRSYCEHNVDLVEVRIVMTTGDDEANRKKLEPFIKAYNTVKKDYPDFKLRFIAASAKGFYLSKEDAIAALDSAIRISSEIMDENEEGDHKMIIGLDLVNEEDAGNPLEDYADYFNSDKTRESGLNYFFHCGESLRLDNTSVLDAYLLGADRVGHGFNLYRFPDIMELYKDEGITLEVCPMSNLRLGYLYDLRLHPALIYLRSGLSVVLASDDAVFMMENPLVDDFYAAIMNWDLDLADVKMLCRNSIESSGLAEDEKQQLLDKWEKDWDAFVEKELAVGE